MICWWLLGTVRLFQWRDAHPQAHVSFQSPYCNTQLLKQAAAIVLMLYPFDTDPSVKDATCSRVRAVGMYYPTDDMKYDEARCVLNWHV
jgi:hypothetical protein